MCRSAFSVTILCIKLEVFSFILSRVGKVDPKFTKMGCFGVVHDQPRSLITIYNFLLVFHSPYCFICFNDIMTDKTKTTNLHTSHELGSPVVDNLIGTLPRPLV